MSFLDTNTTSSSNKGSITPNLSAQKIEESGNAANQMTEGPVARAIEKRTAQLPSDIFLWAALGSIVLSASLQLTGRRQPANFVGHWAPTFLTLGLYNKLVKVAGHDRVTE